jgi:hypothetical protein
MNEAQVVCDVPITLRRALGRVSRITDTRKPWVSPSAVDNCSTRSTHTMYPYTCDPPISSFSSILFSSRTWANSSAFFCSGVFCTWSALASECERQPQVLPKSVCRPGVDPYTILQHRKSDLQWLYRRSHFSSSVIPGLLLNEVLMFFKKS